MRHVLILISIAYFGCSVSSRIPTDPPTGKIYARQLKPLGRFARQSDRLELISSGAHFTVSFEDTACSVSLSTPPAQFGYVQYELDGVYQKRVRIEGEQELKIEATPGTHMLRVFKTTEAHSGPILVHEVLGKNVKALEIPNLPIIEFIGNSITCGAAADPSEIACGTGSYHDQHNAYYAYGPRIARALNTNYMLTSVSGIGIYRNWNSDGPTMPQVFENTDLREGSAHRWDFNTFSPAVVSIALGTNDFSNGDGKKPRLPFDSAMFTRNYVAFVKTVKAKYPKAIIILLNSPMVSGTRNDILIDCLNRVKRQTDASFPADKPVSILLFKPMKARGCGGHPSVEDHGEMAEQMVEGFRLLLPTR